MKKIAVIIVIILVLASIALVFGVLRNRYQQPKPAPPSGQETTYRLGPGDYDFTLEHEGLTRVYSIHAPPSYNGQRPTPVILNLHGGGGNVGSMRLWTLLDQTSDKEGFIVVYPEGTGPKVAGKTVGSWNAGRCCPEAMYKKIDDVGFISQLIEQLKKDFNVDPRRIFATGHSNGAQMSFRLACELSDTIAAIAPVGVQGVLDSCAPTRPVPLMYFHGTADSCAPYNGGTAGGCFQDILNELMGTQKEPYTWQADSAPIYTEKWVKLNGVSGDPKITYQKGNAKCQTWGEGKPGEVVLCTIQGMGHTWPGGTYGDPCKFPNTRFCKIFKNTMGPLSNDIIANDAMWDFFKRYPNPKR